MLGALARLVKVEHSVFALPFAYIGLFVAAGGWPGWRAFVLLTLAMVAMRSFAMAVNRLADVRYDRVNPRTSRRELVTGEVTLRQAWVFTAVCAVVFVAACAGLNALCLALAPVALVWGAFYSVTKRFTWLCHFVLGSVLGLAPVAGWLAVKPEFSLAPILFGLGVTCWTAGFDVLYACQDVDFDREQGLWAMPARFGVGTALKLAAFSHVDAALFFLLAGYAAGLSWIYYAFWAVCSLVLLIEHRLLSEDDLSRINVAFFTLNGIIAVLLGIGTLLAVFLAR
ncbi:4-hydroxybenzoate polyprenyltransferase [Solidesulfovibrio fructosivorans JJ]]|uniref:4-hydroxybenzoate polyprenyltransferase n=1 Tax=Solidesulfovibrio fructosivorans JJ] TaxID=596151 RepID=E1JRV9_SOLFR|nr:4-hydroxybenzoate octaprenyltransferase [Solidesulfovibrio fructosivorans]EFL52728.1 4-hydroxybenzoate polyprenyltransferase [Solidesulfovibrio fructosivorans JJ]]